MNRRAHNPSVARQQQFAGRHGQNARATSEHRRGNTIVLVIGILVLLVIIATAFVVRTQAGRVTSNASSAASLTIDNHHNIGDDVAQEISISLFPRPMFVSVTGGGFGVDANTFRFAPDPSAVRYSTDTTDIFPPIGRPDFPQNHAPFAVVPWTNPPDFLGAGNASWPRGIGNQAGGALPAGSPLAAEDNPLGYPGFGDCRWLRDLEPLRWDSDADGDLDAFSYFRHFTNIARPDNGWRIVRNAADIEGTYGFGGLVTDLNIPVEQWLAYPNYVGSPFAARFSTTTGDAIYPGQVPFENQWVAWFSSLTSYAGVYADPANAPLNLYRLRDLNANGIVNEVGERPQDEFVGNTMRWSVSRVLTDTDADGYTDSFWFLAPTTLNSGIRQIVGVSIIDNGGMANANVATRFIRSDPTGIFQKTRGLTPTDFALVGQGRLPAFGNFNCGLYDTWENWLGIAPEINVTYDTDLTPGNANNLWFRHLREVGLTNAAGVPLDFPNTLTRLDYWRRAASNPLSPDPTAPYTPFGLETEMELRMYAGQNYPWIGSRFEWSADSNINGTGTGPFRSGIGREESSEYLDQLFNRVYARDLRHITTLFNGARNETMPPWLWLYGPNKDLNGDGLINNLDADLDADGTVGDVDDVQLFLAGQWKFDLRLPYDFGPGGPNFSVVGDFNGLPGFEFTPNSTALQYGIALRDRFFTSLIDAYDNLPGNRGTYFGNAATDLTATAELSAAYAANVIQWRDVAVPAVSGDVTSHEVSPLEEAIPIAPTPGNLNPTDRFVGMEPQPFLVEAFVGHIYQSIEIPAVDGAGVAYPNAGQNVVTEDDTRRSTIIVVQFANPYRRPINLDDPNVPYQVRVFGQDFSLTGLGTQPPASEDQPATLILYAIEAPAGSDPSGDPVHDGWVDFLDINALQNLCPKSRVVRVQGAWDVNSRNRYDTSSQEAFEIRRGDVAVGATPTWVTIDRLDPVPSPASDPSGSDRRFGEAVNGMLANRPPVVADPPATYIQTQVPPEGYPGHDIGPAGDEFDYWVQWVRGTRAWGVDVDNDGQYDFNEMSPRYVFGDYAVVLPGGLAMGAQDPDVGTLTHGGNRYKSNLDPDAPWFTRPYQREAPFPAPPGQNLAVINRKPTFFDFNHGELPPAPAPAPGTADPAWPGWSYPDKGWYGQGGTGTADDPVIVDGPSDPSTGIPGVRNYRTPFAFQMLHKDGDFEQVGELLNVFLYGHRVKFTNNTPAGTFTGETVTTFSEYMSKAYSGLTSYADKDQRYRMNRLVLQPVNTGSGTIGSVIGVGDPSVLDDPRHGIPDLPAGVRVLEGFVCDSWGIDPMTDLNGDGTVDILDAQLRTFNNAKGFDGTATPGMPNINTAPVVVTRTAPHMLRLVHETGSVPGLPSQPYFNNAGQPLVTTATDVNAALPRVMLSDAIVQYRERFNGFGLNLTGTPFGADYSSRPGPRGIQTIGEILLMNLPGQAPTGYVQRATSTGVLDVIYNQQWRADMAITEPAPIGGATPPMPFFDSAGTGANQISMRVSTDRQDVWNPFPANPNDVARPDYIAGDIEEANMLFSGISNLVTTRSDVFTVYFRVRSFRQNTSVSPPVWDATNPEYIVDDSRYVMLVDRSGVNHPNDKPRILYFEKLPN